MDSMTLRELMKSVLPTFLGGSIENLGILKNHRVIYFEKVLPNPSLSLGTKYLKRRLC